MRGARRRVGADDVIIEHAAYGVALVLQPREHVLRAEQALLFAGDHGEQYRGTILRRPGRTGASQEPGALQADCNSGSVIIRAGRVYLRIQNVTGAAVHVPGNQEDSIGNGEFAAGKESVDVLHGNGLPVGPG